MLRQFGLVLLTMMALLCSGCVVTQQAVPGAEGGSGGGTLGYYTTSEATLINRLKCQDVQVIKYGDYVRIIFYTDNYFEWGTPNLNYCSDAMLRNLVQLLKRYGDTPITIKGYSDTVLSCCDSQRLSQEMADSVLAYFWAHGIPHQQMCAIGYGYCDPIASIHTVCGKAFNRRIEITLQQQE